MSIADMNEAADTLQSRNDHAHAHSHRSISHEDSSAISSERVSGGVGRPRIYISREKLQILLKYNFSAANMAKKLEVSSSYIYKRLRDEGLSSKDRYSNLSREELMDAVASLKKDFPNAGYRMMQGLLQSQGFTVQRHRVRDALRAVDPVGTIQRRKQAVSRRTYNVAAPNSMWHMDGNMKLARYGMAVHGAIDGYSHMVLYLKCLNNNRAASVLSLFVKAIVVYGIPSRVRSDHGMENVDVAALMHIVRGRHRSSHITGSSVHNQRIERLWRDVYHQVLKSFKDVFLELQSGGLLDTENMYHLKALHFVYMPVINTRLETFREGWNNHKMSTDYGQRTPNQQWIDGMVEHADCGLSAVDSVLEGSILEHSLEHLPFSQNLQDSQSACGDGLDTLSPEEAAALMRGTRGIDNLKAKYIRAVQIVALDT